MNTRILSFAFLSMILVGPSCFVAAAAPVSDNPSNLDASKDLSADLKKLMEAAHGWQKSDPARLTALSRTFALPSHEAWFKKTFGDEAGAVWETHYVALLPELEPAIQGFFNDDGQSSITIIRVTTPGDPAATGAQRTALEAMKQPTALYSVGLAKEGKAGQRMWSWVYADGGFRLIGKR